MINSLEIRRLVDARASKFNQNTIGAAKCRYSAMHTRDTMFSLEIQRKYLRISGSLPNDCQGKLTGATMTRLRIKGICIESRVSRLISAHCFVAEERRKREREVGGMLTTNCWRFGGSAIFPRVRRLYLLIAAELNALKKGSTLRCERRCIFQDASFKRHHTR